MTAAPLIIGHRGAPGYRPEHTRSSYELAIASGVDAVEPDIVVSADGVLVVRHENEISGTTDVADHPEFADRRCVKIVDGEALDGWFTEDFTWAELQTLTCRERIPEIRPANCAFNDTEPMLRLEDLLLLLEAHEQQGASVGVVIEIKHATYFASLGFDLAALLAAELHAGSWSERLIQVVIESFEQSPLMQLRDLGVDAQRVYLMEHSGAAHDLLAAYGEHATTYEQQRTPAGLEILREEVDGISLSKRTVLRPDTWGRATGPAEVVNDAHDRGLDVFVWTARAENTFLLPQFRNGAAAERGHYTQEWALLVKADVDGVFVDQPDLGVTFFRP